jgi:hypothetical protein
MDLIVHPSSIMVTASEGTLMAWDLLANSEMLRSIPLTDDVVPVGMSTGLLPSSAGSRITTRLTIDGNTVFCDLGR